MLRFILIPTLALTACASSQSGASLSTTPPENSNLATLHIRPGEDRQAHIISFNGIPFEAFEKPWAKPGPYRILLQPGIHELRVVIPGMCTYYDGTPGTGSWISTMRFDARAGAQYEVSVSSFPSQILTRNEVHVSQLLEGPNHVRNVEKVIATESDPSSCPNGRGTLPPS